MIDGQDKIVSVLSEINKTRTTLNKFKKKSYERW